MYQVERTLFILTENVYIHCDNERIAVESNGKKYYLGFGTIESIIIFTDTTTLSVYTMHNCSEHKITIHYISKSGKYMGSFYGCESGNVLLRKLQFEMIDTEKASKYVKNLLAAKMKNSVWNLKYFGHHSEKKDEINKTCDQIIQIIKKLKNEADINNMRLMEATCARLYFSMFDYLIKIDDMKFQERSRRPARNCFNALLSFFYTLMTSVCDSALLVRGLDAECGYLHTLRSGRHSLACDLVEEFRAYVVDKFVITIVNRKQVKASDFINENGKIILTDDARKKLIGIWDAYLNTTMVHHDLYNKDMSLKILVYEQAQLLAQYIRGDISEYPPFYAKRR